MMIKVASVFAQVISLIDRRHFARTVHRLGAERAAKGFACWDQLVAMLFCQLAAAHSLREISGGLATYCAKFDYDWVINRIVNFFGTLQRFLADLVNLFDNVAIDSWLVNGIPKSINWCGGQLRYLQTGRAQNYMLLLVIGFLILIGLVLIFWSAQISAAIALLPGS